MRPMPPDQDSRVASSSFFCYLLPCYLSLHDEPNYTRLRVVANVVHHHQPELILTGRGCAGVPRAEDAAQHGIVITLNKRPLPAGRAELEFVVIKVIHRRCAADLNDPAHPRPCTGLGDAGIGVGAVRRLPAGRWRIGGWRREHFHLKSGRRGSG